MHALPLHPDGSLNLEALFARNAALYGHTRMDGTDDGGDDAGGDDDGDKPAFKAPTSQDELDKLINKAVARTHAKYKNHDELAAKAAKLDELEDKNKSENQKLQDELAKARTDGDLTAAQLQRLEVAIDKAPDGMSLSKVKNLAQRLTGSNREELEADAEELFADFAGGSDDDGGKKKTDPKRKPKERLRGGGDPDDEPDETDPAKLAAKIKTRF